MAKYHIGRNGPGICKAEKRPCIYGGGSGHYPTQQAVENRFQEVLQKECTQFADIQNQERPPSKREINSLIRKYKQEEEKMMREVARVRKDRNEAKKELDKVYRRVMKELKNQGSHGSGSTSSSDSEENSSNFQKKSEAFQKDIAALGQKMERDNEKIQNLVERGSARKHAVEELNKIIDEKAKEARKANQATSSARKQQEQESFQDKLKKLHHAPLAEVEAFYQNVQSKNQSNEIEVQELKKEITEAFDGKNAVPAQKANDLAQRYSDRVQAVEESRSQVKEALEVYQDKRRRTSSAAPHWGSYRCGGGGRGC